jgi:hypothetical protein
MKYILKILFILLLMNSSRASAQQHSFEFYRVKSYAGHKAKLVIKDNSLAQMYRTTIADTYYNKPRIRQWHGQGGLNFAGHYCFVYWGCGSDCQHGVIVDIETGKVYDGPTASRLFEYKPWSRLLIVNTLNPKTIAYFVSPNIGF